MYKEKDIALAALIYSHEFLKRSGCEAVKKSNSILSRLPQYIFKSF